MIYPLKSIKHGDFPVRSSATIGFNSKSERRGPRLQGSQVGLIPAPATVEVSIDRGTP